MPAIITVLGSLLFATTATVVSGEAADVTWRVSAACPSPEDLSRRLAPLVAPLSAGRERYVVVVADALEGIDVELTNERGHLARRTVARRDCAELAELIAVIVAAWRIELESDVGTAPMLALVPAVATRELSLLLAVRPPASGASIGGDAELSFSVWPPRWPLSPRFALWASLPAGAAFASGDARWQRVGGEIGAQRRLQWGPTSVVAGVGLDVAWLHAWGEGFADNDAAGAFQPAARALLGVTRRFGRLAVQAYAGMRLWLNRQVLVVSPALGSAAERLVLPRAEPLIAAGVAYIWP